MDKDKIYGDIDEYNNEMINLKIYDDNDDDVFKQMEDSSESLDKLIFVKIFILKII